MLMWVNPLISLVSPFQRRSFMFHPIHAYAGESQGVILPGHTGEFAYMYPPVSGVVQAVHPTCELVEVGQQVLFPAYSYTTQDGLWFMDERAVLAILEDA
jgi:hypothetical protein